MRIKKSNFNDSGLVIDLTGPGGNAYNLLATADDIGSRLYDEDKVSEILEEMKSGDYDNLVDVFDKYFGSVVTLLE